MTPPTRERTWRLSLGRFRSLTAAEAAIIGLGVIVYLTGSLLHGRLVNTDVQRADQSVYLNYARGVADQPPTYIGNRTRMPLYPYLLALFYDDDSDQDAFFERGKTLNIALGGLLLVLLYLFLRSSLPLVSRMALWSITAFTVFMFRAAYVQPELLFYSFFFAGFYLMVQVLHRPTWHHSALAGIALGLAYLSKAAVPPGLALFLAFVGLSAALGAYRRFLNDEPVGVWLGRRLARGALVAATFLAVIYPFIRTSKRVYGQYFYNPPSTYYMWYDSWEDAVADKDTWSSMPPEAVPSPTNYLRNHTAWEVLRRPWYGLRRVYHSAANSYGYLKYAFLYVGLAAVGLLLRPREAAKAFHEQPVVPLFVASFIAVYLLLYAWYAQITDGNRLILVLFLPLMWSLFRLLENEHFKGPQVRLRGRLVPWATVAHGVVGAFLVVDLTFLLWPRLVTVYAGY